MADGEHQSMAVERSGGPQGEGRRRRPTDLAVGCEKGRGGEAAEKEAGEDPAARGVEVSDPVTDERSLRSGSSETEKQRI